MTDWEKIFAVLKTDSDRLSDAVLIPRIYRVLSCVQLFATLWTITRHAPHPWDSPGLDTGVGCHALLQRNFLTHGTSRHLHLA